MSRDPEWEPHYSSPWDFRYTLEVDITTEGFSGLVQQKLDRDEEGVLHGKIALLINRKLLTLFGRFLEIKGDTPTRHVRIFERESEARAWLGLPDDADLWAKASNRRITGPRRKAR